MVGLRKGFIGILNEKATELNVQKDDLIVLHCINTDRTCVQVHSTPECYECGSKNHQLYSILRA